VRRKMVKVQLSLRELEEKLNHHNTYVKIDVSMDVNYVEARIEPKNGFLAYCVPSRCIRMYVEKKDDNNNVTVELNEVVSFIDKVQEEANEMERRCSDIVSFLSWISNIGSNHVVSTIENMKGK